MDGHKKLSAAHRLFWYVAILGSCVLFLSARAHRWVEGVTLDDALSLLLGALPFAFFTFVVPRLSERGNTFVDFHALSWILTLTSFLVFRLNRLTVPEDFLFNFVERGATTRLVASLAYAFLGTLTAALFFIRQFRSEQGPIFGTLIIAWLFDAAYMWIGIFLLPPSIGSS